VFLDANILFSASDTDSATRRLLEQLAGRNTLVTSPLAWEEAQRNLVRKRPHMVEGLNSLRAAVHTSRVIAAIEPINLAEKDQPILAGAVGSGCTHLWTSDRLHFGELYGRTVQGVRVVSSLQLAALMKSDAENGE
jgi:hypothetical protein